MTSVPFRIYQINCRVEEQKLRFPLSFFIGWLGKHFKVTDRFQDVSVVGVLSVFDIKLMPASVAPYIHELNTTTFDAVV